MFSPLFAPSIRPASIARFIFLDPASREFYVEWDRLTDARPQRPAGVTTDQGAGHPRVRDELLLATTANGPQLIGATDQRVPFSCLSVPDRRRTGS